MESLNKGVTYRFMSLLYIMWKEISKFGPNLEYCGLPTMISNVNFCLRLLTLNVDTRMKTAIPFVLYISTASLAAVYYYGYLFSMLWLVFWRSPQTGEIDAAIIAGSLGLMTQIAPIKLLYMIVHASKLRCLVDQYLELDALSESDARFSGNMRTVLRKVKIRALLFCFFTMMSGMAYLIIPVFLSGRHLPEDLFVYYGLEPVFETPSFEISYALMSLSVVFITYTLCAVAVFLIIIIGYTEAQMISLSQEILCVWDDSVKVMNKFKTGYTCIVSAREDLIFDNAIRTIVNLEVRKRLVHILQNHSRTVTLFSNLDELFNVPNAEAFGCFGISLIGFLLAGLEKTYLQIPFAFVHVAMDCFIGQRVTDASTTFEKAIYNCKWESFDKDNMKIVLLMLQNSQKTLTWTAGGLIVLNFNCLLNVIRMVYSTYTTLRSMM